MTTDRYRVSERREGENVVVQATAPSMRELKRHLGWFVLRYPQLQGVDLLKHAGETTGFVEYLGAGLAALSKARDDIAKLWATCGYCRRRPKMLYEYTGTAETAGPASIKEVGCQMVQNRSSLTSSVAPEG